MAVSLEISTSTSIWWTECDCAHSVENLHLKFKRKNILLQTVSLSLEKDMKDLNINIFIETISLDESSWF